MTASKPTPHGFRPHFDSENWKNKVQEETARKGKFCNRLDITKGEEVINHGISATKA